MQAANVYGVAVPKMDGRAGMAALVLKEGQVAQLSLASAELAPAEYGSPHSAPAWPGANDRSASTTAGYTPPPACGL